MLFIIQNHDAYIVEQNIVDLWETRIDLLDEKNEDNDELLQLLETGCQAYNVYKKIGMERAAGEVEDYNNKIRTELGNRCRPKGEDDGP